MLSAVIHFLEVCGTLVALATDAVVWWMTISSFRHRRLAAPSITELAVRFLASFSLLMYATVTLQVGLLISYASYSLVLVMLGMTQFRNARLFHAAGIRLTTPLRLNRVVGVATVALMLLFTIVMTFAYRNIVVGTTLSGVTAVALMGISAVPLVARAVLPQSDVKPVARDPLVNTGRAIAAVIWILYGLSKVDPFIVAAHAFVVVSSLMAIGVTALGLQLPTLAPRRIGGLWANHANSYLPGPEDSATRWGHVTYGWVSPFAESAASESLTVASLPQPTLNCRTWATSTLLCAQMQEELSRFHSWRPLLHKARVRASWDAESCGVLRWVGFLSRHPTPLEVFAGIEWDVAPASAKDAPSIAEELINGTWEGEHLFDQRGNNASGEADSAKPESQTTPRSSLVPVNNVVLISEPTETSLPVVGTPVAPSVVRALFAATWDQIWIQAPFRMIADICMLSSPLILEGFVKFLQSPSSSAGVGAALVIAFFFVGALQSSLLHRYYHLSIRAGISQRNALLGVLFEKCFLISAKDLAHPDMGTGRVVNMMSSDAERFNDFQQMLLFFWSYPFQVVCGICLLYRLVGWCAIGSILALWVAIPLQQKVAALQQRYRHQLVIHTDQRVKLTNELFSGIRIVKFMGWERNFLERLCERREKELHFLRKAQVCRILSALVTAATPTILVATVFILYHLAGNELTPHIVFPCISILSLLRIPFLQIPTLFTTYIQFSVAAQRITKFLMCEDQEGVAVQGSGSSQSQQLSPSLEQGSCAAEFDNATIAAYVPQRLGDVERAVDDDSCVASLRRAVGLHSAPRLVSSKGKEYYCMTVKRLMSHVHLRIPRGKLTVIVGPTGSGKSTLLDALLGQFDITEGSVSSLSSIAYVPQQPWIMNATVRDNILFFSREDRQALEQAIKVCQLTADLTQLPGGLETEIGEKGVNLSGGQRARVSMARAVYAKKELYLLDDPLSALDAHVGAALMRDCILSTLSYATRILATHHVHVLPKADFVVVLGDGGAITFAGTYSEYAAAHRNELAALGPQDEVKGMTEDEVAGDAGPNGSPVTTSANDDASGKSPAARAGAEAGASPTCPSSPTAPTVQKLMTVEEKASGSIPWAIYERYGQAAGGLAACVAVVAVFFITEGLIVSNTVWLSLWSVQMFGLSQNIYLATYLVVITIGIVAAPLRYWMTYERMRTASMNLHTSLVRSVIRAPMVFFDTTPLGRIINRFVQDIDSCDNSLQLSMVSTLQMGFSALSTAVIMLTSQPVALVALVPCCVVYFRLLVFYNAANREARRISNVVKSPVFSLLTEVLSGARTIRAYQKASNVMDEAIQRLDVTFSAAYMQSVLNRWLGIRIELLGNAIVTTVALATMLGKLYGFGNSNVAILSLGLTMSMTITALLNWMVRQVSAVESDMSSVERIIHYTDNVEHEDLSLGDPTGYAVAIGGGQSRKDDAVLASIDGSLELRNVDMRYRPGLPLVLNHLSFTVRNGERVGVVGRTGSGKSSLLMTFLRIVEICGGEIIVGGVRMQDLTLEQLRKLFSMIPQDPILFDGTVRTNLDPFGENNDEAIDRALQLVGMHAKVHQDSLGLEGPVLDGGSNFSVGQRQLLCMARAILKRSCKFILMDEATANIDPELDRLIQNSVRVAFAGLTVITIAHRLHTVASYDKIVVMDRGAAAEVGTPQELYLNGTLFRGLIEQQEKTSRDEILKIMFPNDVEHHSPAR